MSQLIGMVRDAVDTRNEDKGGRDASILQGDSIVTGDGTHRFRWEIACLCYTSNDCHERDVHTCRISQSIGNNLQLGPRIVGDLFEGGKGEVTSRVEFGHAGAPQLEPDGSTIHDDVRRVGFDDKACRGSVEEGMICCDYGLEAGNPLCGRQQCISAILHRRWTGVRRPTDPANCCLARCPGSFNNSDLSTGLKQLPSLLNMKLEIGFG